MGELGGRAAAEEAQVIGILRFWREILVIGLLLGLLWYRAEVANKNTALAKASAQLDAASEAIKASESARKQEEAQAKRANAIAAKYEQDKQYAEAAAKLIVDDLRAGNLRLRKQWQGCKGGVPKADGSAGESDAEADDRAESAGRIIRAADEADAQIKALQGFILSERIIAK